MSSLTVSALNPDSQIDVSAVTTLFQETFGKNYSIPSVYDPKFWHSHLGSRFFGLGVRNGKSGLLGFLAVERLSNGTVRFLYPAIHPDSNEEVSDAMSQRLSSLAARQDWTHSQYFLSDADSKFNTMVMNALGGRLIAALPNYFANGSQLNLAYVGYRIWNKLEQSPIYFLPSSLTPTIEKLSSVSGIHYKIETSNKGQAYPLPADCQGFSMTNYGDGKPVLVYLEPSLLSSSKSALTDLSKIDTSRHFIFININDPKASDVISSLLDSGYDVGGIVPGSVGGDRLLMSRTTPESYTREPATKEAQSLLEILGSSTTASRSRTPNITQGKLDKRRATAA